MVVRFLFWTTIISYLALPASITWSGVFRRTVSGGIHMELIWLQGASCSGCSMNFVCSKRPNILELQERYGIDFLFHPSLSEKSGNDVQDLLEKYTKEPIDILVIEGGVLTGPDGTGAFHHFAGSTFKDWVNRLAAKARYVVAIGSCSSYGGIPSLAPNPCDVTGLQWDMRDRGGFLGEDYTSAEGVPVINVSGCPVPFTNIVTILIDIAKGRVVADSLDEFGRPKDIFFEYPHHGCPKNEYFEYRQEAEHVGERGCMFENLGCHGPLVRCNSNIHRWFDGWGSCTWYGYPCIGCVSPGFPEEAFPLFETPKIAGIPKNLPVGVKKSAYLQAKTMGQRACPDRLKIRKED